jgi:CHAD domain-containing protein
MRGALRRIRRARKLCAVLGKALSAPRSHQVHLGILQGIQDGCRGEASRVYMESVVVARGAALQESLARAAEAIRAFPADRLRRTVHQAVLRSAVALGPVPSAPATALLPVVKEAAARALASRSKEDLHQLRIDLKKLRYRLEASSHAKTPLHACAKHAQDVLGDAHDRDELILGFEEEVGRLRAAKARIMLRECRRSLAALRRERERILEGLDLGPILEASAAVADEGTAA